VLVSDVGGELAAGVALVGDYHLAAVQLVLGGAQVGDGERGRSGVVGPDPRRAPPPPTPCSRRRR
jgi:hypothetical protein